MLKRFKFIKGNLQAMVISDKWESYGEDDVVKARHVKELVLDDIHFTHILKELNFHSGSVWTPCKRISIWNTEKTPKAATMEDKEKEN